MPRLWELNLVPKKNGGEETVFVAETHAVEGLVDRRRLFFLDAVDLVGPVLGQAGVAQQLRPAPLCALSVAL